MVSILWETRLEQFAKELQGDVALWARALEAAGIKQQ